MTTDRSFSPKNGVELLVLCICRISGANQDPLSLKDQEALLRKWVKDHHTGRVKFKIVAGIGSGEILDRKESLEIEEDAQTGKYDLIIAEDLGRIYRRLDALRFCEMCEDLETRVVAINDHIDTISDEWKTHGYFAVMRHEMYNRDTARRIRRTLRNRFTEGGVIQTLVPGYVKPPGTKSDKDVHKDPAFEPIYQKWFELLEGGASYAEVADWLNETHVPLGRYAKGTRWDRCRVSRITHNPILKGVRQRNRKMSVRVNKTGRHRQVNAPPAELLERQCPHLAFIETERYDRLLLALKRRNSHFRRKPIDGRDPRLNVSRKRTAWPGQHVFCAICGEMFVYGAHGQSDHLICSGAKNYACWVSVSLDGPKARTKICDAIREQLQAIPEFTSELMDAVQREAAVQAQNGQQRLQELERERQKIQTALDRFTKTIAEFGASATIMRSIQDLEEQLETNLAEQREIQTRPKSDVSIPSVADVQATLGEALTGVMAHDQVAIRLIRAVIPQIVVFPVRSVDGGIPVLRARFELNLIGAFPGLGPIAPEIHPWRRCIEIDLFDPPARRAIRPEVMRLIGQRHFHKRCIRKYFQI